MSGLQGEEGALITRWLFAALHLVALGIGPGAVWIHGRALGGTLYRAGLQRALAADNAWGFAAALWLATGQHPADLA